MADYGLDGKFSENSLEIDALLHDPEGPVGELITRIAQDIARVAEAAAPVRRAGNTWSRKSNAQAPGYLKAGIGTRRARPDRNSSELWAAATAPANPGIFLEKPAEQLHYARPFLTTGLWAVTIDGAG